MEITILCDNLVGLPFGTVGEHGFSALVEDAGETILFDTGCGKGILNNTLALGKDLRAVKKLLISHGHFDHTQGLSPVLENMRGVEVFGHPGLFQARVARKEENGRMVSRSIGLPYTREYLEGLGASFKLESGGSEISENIMLTGEIPRVTDFEKGAPDQFLVQGENFLPDPIIDDQALIIRTKDGLVILCGCAHAGMINTIRHAIETTGEERVHAVLGGTHLMFLSEDQLEASVSALKVFDPKLVAVSHCTGMKGAARLMSEFGERFSFAHVGSVFRFS